MTKPDLLPTASSYLLCALMSHSSQASVRIPVCHMSLGNDRGISSAGGLSTHAMAWLGQ